MILALIPCPVINKKKNMFLRSMNHLKECPMSDQTCSSLLSLTGNLVTDIAMHQPKVVNMKKTDSL